jgi:hypothetical protein
MSDISPSKITTDAEFERTIANASFEEIKSLMAARAIQQGLVKRDQYDPNVLIPTEPGTAPQKFARAVTINGMKHIIESDSELGLEKAVGDLFRAELQPAASATQQTEVARDDRVRFTSEQGRLDEAELVRQSDLELRWKRGEISSDVYLTESGALDRALQAQGIDPNALREVSGKKFEQSWADATELFKARHPDWIGGNENRDLIGQILVDNRLVDSEDKLAALESAYNHARDNNLLETETLETRIAGAGSVEQIREVLGRGSSSLFGR